MNVLLFGGCGFCGRHILSELVESDKVEQIRVIDKVPPQMAWLNSHHQDVFSNKKVNFKSANLINKDSCQAAFEGMDFDWVINAAAETKTGLEELVYKEGIFQVSCNIMKIAAEKQVKVFLEISAGQMNSLEKVPLKEEEDCKPWSRFSKFKHDVESEIKATPNLNWIIVRPALIYGPDDKLGLTPRLLVGAISRYTGNEMKLLWDGDLKVNTVHVKDVARAVVWLCELGKTQEIYHLVDEANSTQETITKMISTIFVVNYDFFGNAISKVALADATNTLQLANENHLEPWLKLCTSNGIHNTPLTPYIDLEALQNKHINLDGSKIRKEGFEFKWPKPSARDLIEVLDNYIAMNLLPKDTYPSETTRL